MCKLIKPSCSNVHQMCSSDSRCCELHYFALKNPGIGRNLIYMVSVGTILFFLLILIELRVFDWFEKHFQESDPEITTNANTESGRFFYRLKKLFRESVPDIATNADTDSDVLAEMRRVRGMTTSEIQRTNLVIVSLTKFYEEHLAVNQLSLAVNA